MRSKEGTKLQHSTRSLSCDTDHRQADGDTQQGGRSSHASHWKSFSNAWSERGLPLPLPGARDRSRTRTTEVGQLLLRAPGSGLKLCSCVL